MERLDSRRDDKPPYPIDEKIMKVTAIFGPPGTGKTTELLRRAVGKKALFLSFTRAAALEAASRVSDGQVVASTIHSWVFNHLGVNRAQIVDHKKLMEFGKETGTPFKGDADNSDELQDGDEYASVLSYANNHQTPKMEAYRHFGCPGTLGAFEAFVKSYQNWKYTFGYIDFDDMLIAYLSRGACAVYTNIFLDEAQDCSPLQWKVFEKMLPPDANVVVAGDDDQAIYEWNGADPHGMVNFTESHNGLIEILGRSHRVPRIVHDLAHGAALSEISKRVKKVFMPRDAAGSVASYGDFHNIELKQIAAVGGAMVLARDKWRLEEIKRTLNRDMIPYSVLGGSSPWTSRVAKELREGTFAGWNSKNLQWRDFYAQADLKAPINFTLSTIHQAKGREHNRVILDLNLPMRTLASMYQDRDSELRVLYVGLTRTSDELILCGSNPLL